MASRLERQTQLHGGGPEPRSRAGVSPSPGATVGCFSWGTEDGAENHRKTIGKPYENHRKNGENHDFHRKIGKHSWENHRKMMENGGLPSNVDKKLWNITMLFMGKLTINGHVQ